jgi:hypothetical protein
MSPVSLHRLPRAGVDPIDDDDVALATVLAAVRTPFRSESVVVLLDDARCGLAVVVVTGTDDPDAVVEIAERLFDPGVAGGSVGAVVVASVRPDGSAELADADRWIDLTELADQSGVELLEWYVLGRGVSRPRELVNEPPRW